MKIIKPKLLFLTTQGHWGGAQKYVYDLATSLAGEFDIIVAVGDPEGEKQLQEKLQIIQLQHLRREISPIHDLLAIWEIRNLYKKIKPDIVHLNSSKAGILGSLASQMSNVNCQMSLIYTAHGWVFEEPLSRVSKNLYRLAEKYTARAKDAIIVLSGKDKTIAREKLGIPLNRLTLIPNGLNPPALSLPRAEARQILELKADATVVGTIANHYKTKGLDVLLRAVAEIKKEMDNLQVIIIGDGPERARLKALIAKLNLRACVRLTGFLPDANKYLPALDIFVLPSRKEGLPYTLLEAMRAGLPIIATAVGAMPTVITNGVDGLLVPPESPRALGQALQKFTANQEYHDQLGLAAKRRAEAFSLTKQIQATTTLYRSLLPPLGSSSGREPAAESH